MSNELEFLWFKLFCANGFGPKSINYIYKTISEKKLELEDVFNMDESKFKEIFPKLKDKYNALKKLNDEELYKDYKELKNRGIEIIYLGHQLYPENLLKHSISPILFCQGNLNLLKSESVAIVGSRNASEEGLKLARRFANELAQKGKNVISGYAKGIDTNAHLGALEKDGTTTIVLSYGIMEFSKKEVFNGLKWEGNVLVVSQFHPKVKWSSQNAMSRNKLVCALSEAVIIIESGEEKDEKGKMSGTFNAGKTALEMKIPLFVVDPSYFENPPSGNRKLIECGGIKLHPKNAIETLLKHLKQHVENSLKNTEPPGLPEQPSLFKQN